MNDEIQALTQNNTRVFTPFPPGKKCVGCKWVYKTKFNANGTLERYKVRLVAEGFNQVQGIDFYATYSPVIKLTTVRLILSLASSLNMHLHQLDVHNAFLLGDLDEEVCMPLLKGITPSYPNQVSKFLKSIYGLKQLSRL